jgi:hypothetical protein
MESNNPMDTTRIERDLRVLKLYAGGMTLVVAVLSLAAFTRHGAPTEVGEIHGTKAKFDVIDVERINVIEPDGKYRLVLSNRPRSIGPIYKGKPFGYEGGGRPGMIWFNDEGTENGGFTFSGATCETGKWVLSPRPCTKGTYAASTHFTFDQYNQDQIFVMNYGDDNGHRQVGITINDRHDENIFSIVQKRDSLLKIGDTVSRNAAQQLGRGTPENPGVAERLYIGRDPSKNAILNMRDKFGKTRLRLVVDSLGGAHIDFLDANGKVTNSMTGTNPRGGN